MSERDATGRGTVAMICGACGDPQAMVVSVCPTCHGEPLVEGRYRLDAVLGQGAMGVTYRATRLDSGACVAIKELPFRRIDSMKTKELFEREARVLRQLDHPGVPRHLDDFVAGVGKHTSLYLVQEYIEGKTLAEELVDRRYDGPEVLRILDELLVILGYLHGLSPPVIHRDIKPSNVMRRADGNLVLIDFGSVRDVIKDQKVGGSTVAGTFGYMAPEQFQGIAEPATDIYALGVLAVALLSRRPPDTMMEYDGALRWEGFVQVNAATMGLLTSMLERNHTTRAADASSLRARIGRVLSGGEAASAPARAESQQAGAGPAPRSEPWDALRKAREEAVAAVAATDPARVAAFDPRPDAPPRVRRLPPDWDAPVTTEGTPDSARGVTVGALVVLVLAGIVAAWLVVSVGQQSPPLPPVPQARAAGSRCGEGPCPAVPRGLKELEFGMTRAEAEAKLPELAGAQARPGELVRLDSGMSVPLLGDFMDRTRMPGEVVSVQTTLGTFPATCELEFAVGQVATEPGLSKMTCTLTGFTTTSTHLAAEQTLYKTLTGRYGPPNDTSTPPDDTMMGTEHRATWTWRDDGAELALESHFNNVTFITPAPRPTSTLVLTNTGHEHLAVLAEVQRLEQLRIQKLRREERSEAERRRAEEMKSVEGSTEALGKDL